MNISPEVVVSQLESFIFRLFVFWFDDFISFYKENKELILSLFLEQREFYFVYTSKIYNQSLCIRRFYIPLGTLTLLFKSYY